MIRYFIDKWDKNKNELEKYIRNNTQDTYGESYEDLFKKVIEVVFNTNNKKIINPEIKTIDYGDYQGTLILVFSTCAYQPNEDETFYTVISYGSCSICDTLTSILDYNRNYGDLPCEQQIKDYMTLCLNMVQNIKCFGKFDPEYI